MNRAAGLTGSPKVRTGNISQLEWAERRSAMGHARWQRRGMIGGAGGRRHLRYLIGPMTRDCHGRGSLSAWLHPAAHNPCTVTLMGLRPPLCRLSFPKEGTGVRQCRRGSFEVVHDRLYSSDK